MTGDAVLSAFADQFAIADTELVLGSVSGLGRGYTVGFALIATDRRLIGIDYGKQVLRFWVSMIIGVLVWLLGFVALIPLMLRLNPAFPIVGIAVVVPVLFLARKLGMGNRPRRRKIEIPRHSISGIQYYSLERAAGKSRFVVRTRKNTVLRFWSAGKARHDSVTSLLGKFCTSSEPIIPVTERKPSLVIRENRTVLLILVALLVTIIVGLLILR